MAVAPRRVVRLKYALFDADSGETLEYRDDLVYLHGGYGGAFPKVEAALEGLEVGMKAEVELSPEEGFGQRDPGLVVRAPEEEFPEQARRVGARVEGHAPDGRALSFTVLQVGGGEVLADGNHPYAGMHLRFHFEVLEIRAASAAELRAGYAFRTGAKERPGGEPEH